MTSPATLQSARTVAPGHVRVVAGASVPASTRFIDTGIDLVDTYETKIEESENSPGSTLSQEEELQLIQALSSVLLFAPVPQEEVGVRVGLLNRLDVGLQASGTTLSVDAKYRLFRALALQVGVGTHTTLLTSQIESQYPLFEYAPAINYSRRDVRARLILGASDNPIFEPYALFQYAISVLNYDIDLSDVGGYQTSVPRANISERVHQYGGIAGFRLGPKSIHLLVEVSAMYTPLKARVLGQRVDLSGVTVTPSIALGVEL